MSMGTGIEWTDATWNPVTGCDRVSEGCDHCYALDLAARLKAMGNPRYQRDGDPRRSGPGFGVTLHGDKLTDPLRWKKPRRVFVNSMSDLFHDQVPDHFIAAAFRVMADCPQHTFQVLTKRPGRMASLVPRLERALRATPKGSMPDWPLPNVWLGTSVENQHWADVRIPKLLETPAAVRFLSCEPLLGPVDLSKWLVRSSRWHPADEHHLALDEQIARALARKIGPIRLHWVIVGGESGPRARAMLPEWARSLRNQCLGAGVAFFFKQVGGRTPKAGGRLLDGRDWSEFPPVPPGDPRRAPAVEGLG